MAVEPNTCLSKEQSFFLHLLKDYLYGRKTVLEESIDLSILEQIGSIHQINPIIYHQTKNPLFYKHYASQICRTVNYRKMIDEFYDSIKDYPFIFVKGAIISQLYPIPELRSMGDVDVLIHPEDRDRINEILLNAGFQLISSNNLGEWKYSRNDMLFEVHDTLVHRYEGKESLIEYFSHSWDYVHDNKLDWSFHLLYLIEHLHQHFVGSGVGFRQFMDIAIVCMKVDIDYDWLSDNLRLIGLYDFSLTVFAFIREWFDVNAPLSNKELDDDFYIESTIRIFNNGVFGFDNKDNESSELSFMMHYNKIDYRTASHRYIKRKLFPSYGEMIQLPYCAYLRKFKLLLPFAWLHRIVYRSFNKDSRENLRKQVASNHVNSQMDLLHKWGL